MTARTPLMLLALVLGLGAYLFVFERDGPKQSEIEARDGFLVAPLVRERVTRIRLERGDQTVSLRREGEGFDETWFLEGPVPGDGDSEAIEDFIRNWEFAMPNRTLEEPSDEDLTAFGLDTPTASVTFEMGRTAVRVALGAGKPVDGGGYVRIDDRPQAIVVPGAVVELFEFDIDQFRAEEGPEPTLDDLVAPEADDDTDEDTASADSPPTDEKPSSD